MTQPVPCVRVVFLLQLLNNYFWVYIKRIPHRAEVYISTGGDYAGKQVY